MRQNESPYKTQQKIRQWTKVQKCYRRMVDLKHPTSQYINKVQIFPQNPSTKSRNHSITQDD